MRRFLPVLGLLLASCAGGPFFSSDVPGGCSTDDQCGNGICDPKSNIYLQGTSVDFKDEIMGRGFVFGNPNATHTCGCGSSFSA